MSGILVARDMGKKSVSSGHTVLNRALPSSLVPTFFLRTNRPISIFSRRPMILPVSEEEEEEEEEEGLLPQIAFLNRNERPIRPPLVSASCVRAVI